MKQPAARRARRRSRSGELPTRIGEYEIVQKLAEGGMAEIFLAIAEDGPRRGETCVIKRMLPSLLDDDSAFAGVDYTKMFLDESRLARALDHPNLPCAFDHGTSEEVPYIVMELLSGQDVWHILRSSFERNQFIPYDITARIGTAVCAALHYAHELRDSRHGALQIVHRDVSPQNIFVTHDGRVKLCDFGVAKSRLQQTKTLVGTWKGKVRYLSPEQCRAEPVDRRSDLFALAAVLWEMLMLRRLYSGANDSEIIAAITHKPPPRLSDFRADIPAALEAVIMKGLSSRPADRQQTAAEMGAELEAWIATSTADASAAHLGEFMRDLFGDPPPNMAELVERTTQADPLARRIRDLGWFDAQAGSAPAPDQLVQLHLPGVTAFNSDEDEPTDVAIMSPPPAPSVELIPARAQFEGALPPLPRRRRGLAFGAAAALLLLVAVLAIPYLRTRRARTTSAQGTPPTTIVRPVALIATQPAPAAAPPSTADARPAPTPRPPAQTKPLHPAISRKPPIRRVAKKHANQPAPTVAPPRYAPRGIRDDGAMR